MKMSDALRGAAESAPVAELSISTSAVRSRARRNRLVRKGANGLVGVGAAALVFAGVAGVFGGQTALTAADSGVGGYEDSPGQGGAEPGVMEPGDVGSASADALCGMTFGAAQFAGGEVAATATLGEVASEVLPVSVTVADGAALASTTYYVVWEGLVVSTYDAVGEQALKAEVPLANCWDGSALPAGEYALVAVSLTADEPPIRVATGAVPFTIEGDAAADPFATYLTVPEPPDQSAASDALTPDDARAAYTLGLKGAWAMAAGTQRVLMTGDSADPTADLWGATYFGCPGWPGTGAFPATSAQVDWLDVSVSVPSSIHVSYGWVVDGNPVVHYSVTNTSTWSLPGFYASNPPRLVLVKDGTVVAEAYPVSTDPMGGGIAYPSAGAAAQQEALAWDADAGVLAPGARLSGDYLWRDLVGCWSSSGDAEVKAGTYTVLSSQEVYLGGNRAVAYGTESADAAPAPDGGDYVSFTVWTSLGTVSVQN